MLNRFIAVAILVSATPGALALTGGTDILVPAAARGAGLASSTWITDLYVLNPGEATVAIEIFWLARNQANPSPQGQLFNIEAGETVSGTIAAVGSTFPPISAGCNGTFPVQTVSGGKSE
jgi:hypothetical protein